ncbi:unnamed protein product [Schistosoma margrebowiei]|uniref:Uncharacterized protein n=1 Tax=Schistosoma margrebowiei TaxID=48269 RepID=A0A183MKE8_9TREM|nr:unnamed protein product [Schistosoma margrebowiei]
MEMSLQNLMRAQIRRWLKTQKYQRDVTKRSHEVHGILVQCGRTGESSRLLLKYNIKVLGIRETQWTQAEQQRLAPGELLLYSGYEEENAPHTQGVALMLSKHTQKALIVWESHGPRTFKASFKHKERGHYNERHPMLCAY